VQQAMGVERVAGDRSEVEVEPFVFRDPDEARFHGLEVGGREAILGHQSGRAIRGPVSGCRRVQLERPVDDLDLVAVLERGERTLEPAFADVAPGADDVRPDVDTHASSLAQTCAADPYSIVSSNGSGVRAGPVRGVPGANVAGQRSVLMNDRSLAVLVAASCVMSACGHENPTEPPSVRGESIVISATVPASSIANPGSDAADYPLRRDIQLSIHQSAGFERTVTLTVLNQTLFPMGSDVPRSQIKVGLPVNATVLPADGSISITTPLLHSADLRGTTIELAYTVILGAANGQTQNLQTLGYPVKVRVKL
jgi:hypothetical protein